MSFIVTNPVLRLPPKPGTAVSLSVTLAAVLLVVAVRMGAITDRPIPVGYSIVLLLFVWIRSRSLLWAATIAFCVSNYFEQRVVSPIPYQTPDARQLAFIVMVANLCAISALVHVLISAVDSAERKSKLLSRALAELSAVWRSAPVGLCVADSTYRDVRFNPHGAAMLGVLADEDVGPAMLSDRVGLFRDGKPVPMDQFPLIRAGRENLFVEPAEWELTGPGGRRLTVLLAAAPVREGTLIENRRAHNAAAGDGPSSGSVAAFVDISTVKQLQRELDLRRREAEEASLRKSRFLSSVSHDIRTPANAISLLAELLGHAAASPEMANEVPRFATDLRASARKLVDLVSDVLDFTKLDTARVDLIETVFDLRTLLREEHAQALVVATQKSLPVRVELPDGPIIIRTDRVKLGRVLGNLLSNAVKFTPTGEVTLSASRNIAGDIMIKVADTGIGIPTHAMPRIFDEFYQVRTNSTSRDPSRAGSGLGLAICQRLSAAMGLRLDVASAEGKGTTFTLLIPESLTVPTGHRTGDIALSPPAGPDDRHGARHAAPTNGDHTARHL